MKFKNAGTEENSKIFFYTPSQNAKRLLYFPVVAGDFYCNDQYLVERQRYDSILAIYVVLGSITLDQDGIYTAEKDEVLLVDCYRPHRYFSSTGAHTLWIHFDGGSSRQWASDLGAKKIKCTHRAADCILRIIDDIEANADEYDLSQHLYSLICDLSRPVGPEDSEKNQQVSLAKEFMEAHFAESITVADAAAVVNLSASYFSKLFKDSTNMSPYEYLLSVRLEKAKEMLQETDLPISLIAERTGFNSDANFIYFFKKQAGLSPLKFRNVRY